MHELEYVNISISDLALFSDLPARKFSCAKIETSDWRIVYEQRKGPMNKIEFFTTDSPHSARETVRSFIPRKTNEWNKMADLILAHGRSIHYRVAGMRDSGLSSIEYACGKVPPRALHEFAKLLRSKDPPPIRSLVLSNLTDWEYECLPAPGRVRKPTLEELQKFALDQEDVKILSVVGISARGGPRR